MPSPTTRMPRSTRPWRSPDAPWMPRHRPAEPRPSSMIPPGPARRVTGPAVLCAWSRPDGRGPPPAPVRLPGSRVHGLRCARNAHEPTRGRDEPLPAAARAQSGRLVPVGTGGPGACPGRGSAHLPLDRLRRVPLVPRHGARVVRGRGHVGAAERGVRVHQGGPRGAARPGRDLHDGGAGDDRPGRLADERLPHAGGKAVLRRHVLPVGARPRDARVRGCAGGGRRSVARPPRRGRGDGSAIERGDRPLEPGRSRRTGVGRGSRGGRGGCEVVGGGAAASFAGGWSCCRRRSGPALPPRPGPPARARAVRPGPGAPART